MSYILDALRKADQQREQQRTPGLDAQPLPAPSAELDRRWLAWAIAGFGVLAVMGGGAWLMAPRGDAPGATPAVAAVEARPADATTAPSAPPAATGPAPRAAADAAAGPASTAGPGSVAGAASRVTTSAGVATTPAPASQIEPPPAPPKPAEPVVRPVRVPAADQAATGEVAAARGAASAASAAPAAGAAEATSARGWPTGAPPVAVTGGVHSPTPARRMLIVNGQVFNEGSEVAPGVTLERVQPRQAVLRWNGQRYTVPF